MEIDGVLREQIEKRAYELYLGCGCDGGHDLEHWLAAEEELRQERANLITEEKVWQQQEEPLYPSPLKHKTAVAGTRGMTDRNR